MKFCKSFKDLIRILLFPAIIFGLLIASLSVYAEDMPTEEPSETSENTPEETPSDNPSDTPSNTPVDDPTNGINWPAENPQPSTPTTPATPTTPTTPTTPATPNTPSTTVNAGDYTHPTSNSTSYTTASTTSTSAPELIITRIVTNVTSPNQTTTYQSPITSAPEPEVTEETTTEEPTTTQTITDITPEKRIVEYIIDLSDILASYENDQKIEIPKTATKNTSVKDAPDLEVIRRICLSIFILTGIAGFSSLAIWSVIKIKELNEQNRTKKLYEEAKQKSQATKKIKITRRAS